MLVISVTGKLKLCVNVIEFLFHVWLGVLLWAMC
jgi:hypothetical protein